MSDTTQAPARFGRTRKVVRWLLFAPVAAVAAEIAMETLDEMIPGFSTSNPGLWYALPVAIALFLGKWICPAPRAALILLGLAALAIALDFTHEASGIAGGLLGIAAAMAWQFRSERLADGSHVRFARTRKVLGWVLFVPVAALAAAVAMETLDEMMRGFSTSNPGFWYALPAAVALLVGQRICPAPRVALILLSLGALALTLDFRDEVSGFLGGVLGIAAAVAWRVWRDPAAGPSSIRALRWTYFAPIGFFLFVYTVMEVLHLLRGTWDPAPGIATLALLFVGATLAAVFIAPAHRTRMLLLVAAGTCGLAFALAGELRWLIAALPDRLWVFRAEDLADVVLFAIWAAGTGAAAFVVAWIESRKHRQAHPVSAVSKSHRYKGTAPYQDDDLDRQTFFGREREARSLMSLVLAERLVVLFSKSGLGKSSLINAGLVEPLRARGHVPLVVRLVERNASLTDIVIEGVRAAAKDAGTEVVGGDASSLWLFFKTAEFWSRDDELLRPVLILDQFEEIFTLHGQSQRRQFVAQLGELIRGPSGSGDGANAKLGREPADVHVVVAMREDFLANLEDLAGDIPAILQNRYRLGPLSRDAARAAIVEPAQLPSDVFLTGRFGYEPAAVDRIIAFLADQRVGEVSAAPDEVEPVQLQLICSYLEETVRRRDPGEDAEIVIRPSDLGGDAQMEQVLQGFYDRIIDSVHPRRKAEAVRRLCTRLISSGGRRLAEDHEVIEETYKLSEPILRQLVDARLLRAESRLGSTVYEIGHDRLVEPIQNSNQVFAKQRRRTAYFAIPLVLAGFAGFASTVIESRQYNAVRELEERKLTSTDNLTARGAVRRLARGYHYDVDKLIKQMGEASVVNPSVLTLLGMEHLEEEKELAVLRHILHYHDNFMDTSHGERHDATFLGAVLTVVADAERWGESNLVKDSAANRRCELLTSYAEKHEAVLTEYANENGMNPADRPRCKGGNPGKTPNGIPRTEPVTAIEYQCFNPDHPASKDTAAIVNRYEAVAYAAFVGAKLPTEKLAEGSFTGAEEPEGWQEWWFADPDIPKKARADPLLPRRSARADPLTDERRFTLVWPADPAASATSIVDCP